jgi:hypothetical protein
MHTLPKGAFANLYNSKPTAVDGEYTALQIDDVFDHSFTIKNGQMAAMQYFKRRPGGQAARTCTNWYLLTIYFDNNGTIVSVTGEFVGTTCDDDCVWGAREGGRIACYEDGPFGGGGTFIDPYASPTGGGGGSGGGGPVTFDEMVTFVSDTMDMPDPLMTAIYQEDPLTFVELYYYLKGSSQPQRKSIAQEHIDAMAFTMAIPDTGYRNHSWRHRSSANNNFLWFEDTTWLSNPHNFNLDIDYDGQQYDELTVQEKLLIAVYPKAAIMIKSNVTEALNKAVELYPAPAAQHPGLNDKADAFRHAYFQAINVRDITPNGIMITRMFAEAHESEVPPPLQKEKVMDLFNNEVGIELANVQSFNGLFTSNATFITLIQQLLSQGELQYLTPLNHLDPYWYTGPDRTPKTATNGITAATLIKPTNQ